MIMAGTLIILALWLAFVWFVDPDGYRNARRQSATGGTVHPHKNALNAGQLKTKERQSSSLLHAGLASRASVGRRGHDTWHERHETLSSLVRAEPTPVSRTANGLDCL
jgi:hypothetical protein